MRSIICFEFRTLLLFAPRAYNILGMRQHTECRKTQRSHPCDVSKMFHRLSRDLSVERKEIFVSVNWTHPQLTFNVYEHEACGKTKYLYKTKSPAFAGLTYIQDICLDQISTENRIKVKRNLCEASFALSFGLNFCSSPRSISISQLNTLLCLHPWPIKLVVYKWPYSF